MDESVRAVARLLSAAMRGGWGTTVRLSMLVLVLALGVALVRSAG